MAKNIFFLFSFFYFGNIYAQTNEILEIKKYYGQIEALISKATAEGEEHYGGLFCNKLTINEYNNSWRAVGVYNKVVQFWYNEDPSFNPEEINPLNCLQKIAVDWKSSANNYSEEYLFKNGKLIFYYYNYKEEDSAKKEHRLYFSKNILIKYLIGDKEKNINNLSDEQRNITRLSLKQAKHYQDLFISTFADAK